MTDRRRRACLPASHSPSRWCCCSPGTLRSSQAGGAVATAGRADVLAVDLRDCRVASAGHGRPRGTRRRRSPRSRTARDRGRARASDVQASFQAERSRSRPGSHLSFGSAGTFPASDAPDRNRESSHSRLSSSTPLYFSAADRTPATPPQAQAHCAARRPAPRPSPPPPSSPTSPTPRSRHASRATNGTPSAPPKGAAVTQ